MPSFERAVINVTDAVNQGKDVMEIQTDFCPQDISVLKEVSVQGRLRYLISKICESKGMEEVIDEEVLRPIDDTDQSHLLSCFISILEKFSIQRDEIVVFLKESFFIKDQEGKPLLEHGIDITSFEKEKAINVNLQQDLVASQNISESALRRDHILAMDVPSEVREANVRF